MHSDDQTLPVTTEAEVVADLARAAGIPTPIADAVPSVLVVENHQKVEVVDPEQFAATPRRSKGIYRPADAASFTAYVLTHRDQEGTTIWIDQGGSRITAVLNDHGEDSPGWGDHRAELQLQRTPEWMHWLARDGRLVGQEEFAEHIQDGIREIRTPEAAEMLEIAQSFQGKTKADWKQATRLDNGAVGISYTEEIEASAGRKGDLEIPQEIVLAVTPFVGETPFEVVARLRYKIREGNLSIGYKLERPHEVERESLEEAATRLRDAGLDRVYLGCPPA